MQDCAQLLDQTYATDLYGSALAVMQARIDEVDETLSAHVINDTLKHGGTWSLVATWLSYMLKVMNSMSLV